MNVIYRGRTGVLRRCDLVEFSGGPGREYLLDTCDTYDVLEARANKKYVA